MKKKKINKTSELHLRITIDKRKAVERFCRKQKMSLSKFVEYAIDEYMINYFKGEADE